MAPPAGMKEKLDSDRRDVADLWKDALKEYKGIVGFDLERKFDNVQGMMAFGVDQMENFHKFRHDKGKVDKLRSLFASNLDLIEQGSQQLISAATPAFPPAAAIGTALTYVLKACRQVSADYDVVVVFFDDMNSFLSRIVILEGRLPRYKAYQNCLADVFSSFLRMCGFAQKYIELGRFKKWITNLFKGEDGDLGGARANMNQKLEHLQQATEFAILGNTEETLKMTAQLEENQQAHSQMLKQVGEAIDTIQENTENIRDDVSKLLKLFSSSQKKQGQVEKPQAKKPPSASGVRNSMPVVLNEDHEYNTLKETMVPQTCEWIFSEAGWTDWIGMKDGTRPIFALSAQPGAGKSHIAATLHDKLRSHAQEDDTHNTCVGAFYIREREDNYAWFICIMVTIINQVAEQNSAACEKFSAQIARDELQLNAMNWKDLATHLLGVVFSENSKLHLFIVLDGLDELKDLQSFKDFLSDWIIAKKLRISLVVTSRPEQLKQLPDGCSSIILEATKTKQLQDLKALIWHRINGLDHLKTFSRYVQQRVADCVEESSPNLLYAEHLLTRFNALGREGAVLRALKQPKPDNLNSIYEIMLAECQRRMTSEHQVIASTLLHWVAFAARPLLLNEVESLVKLLAQDPNFTLEEIPEVFIRFLKVGDAGYDLEWKAKQRVSQTTAVTSLPKPGGDDDDDDDTYNDGNLPVGFQERSMRYFFNGNSHTISQFRWSPSEAHRQILLFSLKTCRPDRTDVDIGLQKYGCITFLKHWADIRIAEHTDSELVEVLEAVAETMSNKTGMAEMMGRAGIVYSVGAGTTGTTNERMGQWAELVNNRAEIRSQLSNFAVAWWQDVGKTPEHCRLGLARGFLGDLYRSLDTDESIKTAARLVGVLAVSGLGDVIMAQAFVNFPKEFPNSSGTPSFDEGMACLGILHLFEDDVKPDAGAYRAVAEVLVDREFYEQAETMCIEGLDLCKPTEEEWYRLSNVLSDVLLYQKRGKAAMRVSIVAVEEMAKNTVPPSLRRQVYTTKARAEARLKLMQVALNSYTAAKAADPEGTTPGEDLVDELVIQEAKVDKTDYIQTLKSWGLLERITWAAWDFGDTGDDRYLAFCDIASETGEQDFIVKFYEEIIEFLDHLEAGTPIRIVLALVYLEVCRQPEKTLEILDAIFDSHASHFLAAITSVNSSWMIEKAVDVMVHAQVALFRKSRDPAYKAERLAALANLMKRPFSLDVPQSSPAWTGQQRIGLAYMYMVMGPMTKFQETLQSLMDDCFIGLSDSVGFNDGPFLVLLAQSLAILSRALRGDEKIRRYARIVGSALFSRLDPKVDPDEDEEGEAEPEDSATKDPKTSATTDPEGSTDEEDDSEVDNISDISDDSEAPEDEGDLMDPDDAGWICDGICSPSKTFGWWGGRSAYVYTTYNGFICEECQAKYDAHARGEAPLKGRYFHGIGHDKLKLPIEGWKGVRDGMLTLEGEEPVATADFFKMLRDEVCKDAWDRLWHGM